ncbi:MAG: head-tail adaptor protein [Clostridia bacterium]|nr:head-tail adaptor protein [Clostridia bacterium]
MSIGDLNTPIQILRLRFGRDRDGFQTVSDDIIACVRAKVEVRNATEKWSSRAVLREASAVFTFRRIPHIDITTDMVIVCGADRYNIVSVENVRSRNLYTQVVTRLESEES